MALGNQCKVRTGNIDYFEGDSSLTALARSWTVEFVIAACSSNCSLSDRVIMSVVWFLECSVNEIR